MADENNNEGGKREFAPTGGTIQGNVVADPKVIDGQNGKFVAMRVAVNNGYKKGDEFVETATTYVEVTVNQPALVSKIEGAMAEGTFGKGKPIRVEGYPLFDSYDKADGTKVETVKLAARKGETAIDLAPDTKKRANDFVLSGNIGNIRPVEGEKNGKAYKFYELSVAYDAGQAREGEEQRPATWLRARVNTPKAIEALEAGMADGSIGVGGKILLKGSIEPSKAYTDGKGVRREGLEVNVKPFADSIQSIFAPKNKGEASKDQAEGEAQAPAAEEGKKAAGKGKGKAKAGAKQDRDDEIPF